MKKCFAAIIVLAAYLANTADTAAAEFEYEVSVAANASSGEFAPYMIGSWKNGRIDAAKGVWHSGRIEKLTSLDTRFSWGAGVEYIFGNGADAVNYDRFNAADNRWTTTSYQASPVRLQQLYGELKFRGAYLIAGMKERSSSGIVDDDLSSGDLVRSNNARPIPGVAAGFVDFQNIPFTNGWVQIDGEIMYGRFTDTDFRKGTFNYYSGLLGYSNCFTYKRCYFRTNPNMPFSVTVGMQAAGEFAGHAEYYSYGKKTNEDKRKFQIKDIFDMFFPIEGSGEGYYKGNSLGSWDLNARYDFRNGSTLTAYFEWPWEDGSGIGKATGWDGLWGIEYYFAREGALSKILFEYFDFTNQSGPIHFSPEHDYTNPPIQQNISGGDNYYNNDFYGPYCNYGMSIGSPFPLSPVYNTNGYPGFERNRCRGFHAAAEGYISDEWKYKVMFSYQQAGGMGREPAREILSDTSAKISAHWTPANVLQGLSINAELAFDKGKLRGDNFGALIGISYTGLFNIAQK